MYDAAPTVMQRSQGRAEVALGPKGGVARLFQQGCAKAFLPRCHGPEPEIVFLNTAGGVTGGDRLVYTLDIPGGVTATATTQTAERAYRASGGSEPGRITVDATVGRGGVLHWLPQETILFDGAALDRRTAIDLAPGATLLFCETLILGRTAMGEVVRRLDLLDHRCITRAGRPVLIEPLRIASGMLTARCGGAGLAGATVVATVGLVGAHAENALGAVRAVLSEAPEAAATGWEDKLIVRLVGNDARAIRTRLARILTTLRGRALPRVWQI